MSEAGINWDAVNKERENMDKEREQLYREFVDLAKRDDIRTLVMDDIEKAEFYMQKAKKGPNQYIPWGIHDLEDENYAREKVKDLEDHAKKWYFFAKKEIEGHNDYSIRNNDRFGIIDFELFANKELMEFCESE